jgi:hypothetical protein
MKKTALAHLRRHGPLSLTLWQACADLDENPLTKGLVSSDHARRGDKAAMASLEDAHAAQPF